MVRIYLPRFEGSTVESTTQQAPPVPEGTFEEIVLVVEDDANVRTYSVQALRELGYRVLEASDGPSAIRLLGISSASICYSPMWCFQAA